MSAEPFDPGRAFEPMHEEARLWSFGTDRPLDDAETARLLDVVDGFLAQWKAHGHPLAARREWVHGRFLLVAVDERVTPPSGCSIDALVRHLRRTGEELGVELLGGAPIWFGRDGEIHCVGRPAFREAAARGEVDGDTVVFDMSVTRVGELREGAWQRPARAGWHARYLDGPLRR